MKSSNYRMAVLGLGYVGLPVALAPGEKFPDVVGFDINRDRRTHKKQ
jgi:UDP-N-acetyl-D-galactosamine dehydrogenase